MSKLASALSRLHNTLMALKNCGAGGGPGRPGFQPGNSCARGGRVAKTRKGEVLLGAFRGDDGVWRMDDGNEAPEHVQKLAIPPAWSDVHVNPDPKGNLLAKGVDSKGRAQYRYGQTHTMKASANKFGRVTELRKQRAKILKEINQDIRAGENKEEAIVAKLVMRTGMRPGSDADSMAAHKSYGATTLEGRHIIAKPDGTATIRFVPGKKKGQEIEMPVTDKGLASILIKRANKVGPDRRLFKTNASKLRNYSKTKGGGGFKTKDHRTALGTETAIAAIKSMPQPTTKKAYKAALKEVSTRVSDVLGNTPSVAFKSYIDPHVWSSWKRKAGV